MDIKRVGDAGVHTVEGNLAGSRAASMTKQREKQRAEYEAQKEQIKKANAVADLSKIDSKFSTATNAAEQEFQRKTVGLVTAEEFRKAREEGMKDKVEQERLIIAEAERIKQAEQEKIAQERELKRKRAVASLSFAVDEDEDSDDEPVPVLKKILKDPTVDTSFLPDANRERELKQKKEELKREWLAEQERIKNEILEVTYSYWDGSGHRKVIQTKKGCTIGKFLEAVKAQLLDEFKELRSVSNEDLLYVKEDLIIPQHLSFYDLIITQARGKSGPLFHFDVHEDVRIVNDARVEKDESHPGKVVERRWFEKNKHIFPASRWEIYDPNASRDKQLAHNSINKSTKKVRQKVKRFRSGRDLRTQPSPPDGDEG
eukprot:gene27418-33117_t